MERAVEVLCVVWTSSELQLPDPRNKDGDAQGTIPQMSPHDRELDAKLRKLIQPKAGKLML